MSKAEQIKEIQQEIKELKRLKYWGIKSPRRTQLESKFEEIETLFGHESTLDKAIIYFISQND